MTFQSLLRPQLCLQVLPQASQAAQPRDPRTRSQLLWDAAKCRAAPDTSQERQALKNQLEVLQGGLEAAEQPRWATQLELPPHMDIVCFWEDLLDTHLMHFDMVSLRLLADSSWWYVLFANCQVLVVRLQHPQIGAEEVMPDDKGHGPEQTQNAGDAAMGLELSPLYATLGAAWWDGSRPYELIPYAGTGLSDYIGRRGEMVLTLQDTAADATPQKSIKEGAETPVQQAARVIQKMEEDDSTDFLVCMLRAIEQFHKQNRGMCFMDWKDPNVVVCAETGLFVIIGFGGWQVQLPRSDAECLCLRTAGFWDPIWCLGDETGRPRFATVEGTMPHINNTTNVAQMLLVLLKLAGKYPAALDAAVDAVNAANTPQANQQAARAMLSWVNSLAADSAEWSSVPEELRQMLSDALSTDLTKRPSLQAILYHPCLDAARARVDARVEQHRAGVQQQVLEIYSYMAQQLEDPDHLEKVRRRLQHHKEHKDREETIEMQQHARKQLDLAQTTQRGQEHKQQQLDAAEKSLKQQYKQQQAVQMQQEAEQQRLWEWEQRLQAQQQQQMEQQKQQDERQGQLAELQALLQAQQQQQEQKEGQLQAQRQQQEQQEIHMAGPQQMLQAQQQQQQQVTQMLLCEQARQQAEQQRLCQWQQRSSSSSWHKASSSLSKHTAMGTSRAAPCSRQGGTMQQAGQQQQQQIHGSQQQQQQPAYSFDQQQHQAEPLKPVKVLSYPPRPQSRPQPGPNTPPGALPNVILGPHLQSGSETASPAHSGSAAGTLLEAAPAPAAVLAAALPASVLAAAAAPMAGPAAAAAAVAYACTPAAAVVCRQVTDQGRMRLRMMLCSAQRKHQTMQQC